MDENKKIRLIMIGFAISYLFFGLNGIMDLFSENVKHAVGIAAIVLSAIIMLTVFIPKKEK